MPNRPIPLDSLVPVAVACVIIAALVAFGAPDLILMPIAAITVLWSAVMVARHYLAKKKTED
ncbi:hypothetical protein [Streptomonospora wellingtoniae]|uniref:Uncharacterized protein n=1 Tax=Streptomonospora wellingtoniae TaxID=3075544 RepID=A0ABU2L0F6_9ACTN|nr:hypothetical protein [Streptomonospora sp. DSM 45055]MDT0305042.1 hypothetical protein [Streptomonospora sp. DSM 45055]